MGDDNTRPGVVRKGTRRGEWRSSGSFGSVRAGGPVKCHMHRTVQPNRPRYSLSELHAGEWVQTGFEVENLRPQPLKTRFASGDGKLACRGHGRPASVADSWHVTPRDARKPARAPRRFGDVLVGDVSRACGGSLPGEDLCPQRDHFQVATPVVGNQRLRIGQLNG